MQNLCFEKKAKFGDHVCQSVHPRCLMLKALRRFGLSVNTSPSLNAEDARTFRSVSPYIPVA